ncbi:MAG: KTSC domain-containing protein [Negativicutes bacterium]|nr:KTSC domain-containing protein [Negativicutes bacterium]
MAKSRSLSGNIRSIVYHHEQQFLEISLYAGGSYRYLGVPACVYEQLMSAAEKEDFIARSIKPKYRCSKILIV